MKIEECLAASSIDFLRSEGAAYRANHPYPHIFFDGFFKPDVADFLYNNFPRMEEMPSLFKEPMSYKGQLSDIDNRWPIFSPVFKVLQSKEFIDYISAITGIEGLLEDSVLAGAGLHQSPKSGFLDIHVDANFHPLDKTLHRRVNIIIYLNKGWDAEWGGNLQLWTDGDKKPGLLGAEVEPVFNRAAIFNTTRTSWHGVSPVVCPPLESRKSIALYYYTKTRPVDEQYEDSSVIWMSKTSKIKMLLYPVFNFVISILKPYAKYIRRNVFDASKGSK